MIEKQKSIKLKSGDLVCLETNILQHKTTGPCGKSSSLHYTSVQDAHEHKYIAKPLGNCENDSVFIILEEGFPINKWGSPLYYIDDKNLYYFKIYHIIQNEIGYIQISKCNGGLFYKKLNI